MRPTTPPAAISGKNRFACRVSETRPASPQIARRQVNSATLWRIQSAPYTQVASASTAARANRAATEIAAGMRTNTRSRPTRASSAPTPTVVRNIAIPTRR